MKRAAALRSLSRDHHHGLAVAQQLVRATPETAADARRRFLDFWQAEGRRHFAIEEEVLLPACAGRVPPDDEAVVEVLVQHVDLRRRADDVAARAAPPVGTLQELGRRLRRHIRHEERVLFPRIEAALDPDELARLALALDRAEGRP